MLKKIFLTLFLVVTGVAYAAAGIDDPTEPYTPPTPTTPTSSEPSSDPLDAISEVLLESDIGAHLFEEDIDQVIFQTNLFVSEPTFQQQNGPFWYIMQMCICLAMLFAIIKCAGMAYKMMYKGEAFDPLGLVRIVGVALVMFYWYGGFLDALAYIPNCIGSYTKVLYNVEAQNVESQFNNVVNLMHKRDTLMAAADGKVTATQTGTTQGAENGFTPQEQNEKDANASAMKAATNFAGILILVDKIGFVIAIIIFRIGWWGTIFCQQILLGMLVIFGPILWAFSILPKWESAWSKWLTRFLTVHFYGAMLYFVGFYVLLLFDIVLTLQADQLSEIVMNAGNIDDGNSSFIAYIKSFFFTSCYMIAASVVSLQCLNLVPDLAAWMIPEGDTAFATRSFGSGVAQGFKGGLHV